MSCIANLRKIRWIIKKTPIHTAHEYIVYWKGIEINFVYYLKRLWQISNCGGVVFFEFNQFHPFPFLVELFEIGCSCNGTFHSYNGRMSARARERGGGDE